MWFLMKARFEIVRLPLDLWHWNESKNGLYSWFWVPVGPTHKMREKLNWQFTICLEKCDFFANDSKYRHIIYCWKSFFATNMDSRSCLKIRLRLARIYSQSFSISHKKSVSMIRALSSWTEGTISKSKLRWVIWSPRPVVRMAREWCFTTISLWPPTRHAPPPTVTTGYWGPAHLYFGTSWSSLTYACPS